MSDRYEWARRYLDTAPRPIPRYGSSEWLALPDGPVKVASVVIAAEAWARDLDNLAENLRVELEAAWRANKAAEDDEFRERAEAWRQEWQYVSDAWVHPANRRGAA